MSELVVACPHCMSENEVDLAVYCLSEHDKTSDGLYENLRTVCTSCQASYSFEVEVKYEVASFIDGYPQQ